MTTAGLEGCVEERRLVHLVDDSASMRAMTSAILEEAGLAVREYPSAGAFLTGAGLRDGDCVLTDVRMPRIDGLELMTRLRGAGSTVPVVVFTGHGDVPTAVRAMRLGAFDFIEKPFRPETLLHAVRSALREARTLSRDVRRGVAVERLGRLTERERQVLEHLLRGLTHREIGEALKISPRTVEVFRARIMGKMECETVQDLVRAAIEAGWD